MLSLTAEYALRAALYLGRQPAGKVVPAERIAQALDAPRNYLSKTLNELAKRGIVTGIRGPRGGFMLAVPANELSVYELIGHFDDLTKSRFCLLGGVDCDARRPCLSHARWNRLVDRSIEPLRSTTIADLLAGAGDDLSPAETENGVALEPSLGPPPTRLTPSPGSNGNGRLPLVNSYQSRGR